MPDNNDIPADYAPGLTQAQSTIPADYAPALTGTTQQSAPATAAPSLPVASSQQQYVSPYTNRQPFTGWDSFKHNISEDAGDFGTGISTLSSLAGNRIREGIEGIGDAARYPLEHPLDAFLLHQQPQIPEQHKLLRASDIGTVGGALKGMVDYYNNEYLKPMANEDKDTTTPWWSPEHSVLLQHFRKAPLATFLDLYPGIPGTKIIPKAVGAAFKATPKALTAASKVAPEFARVAPRPVVANTIRRLRTSARITRGLQAAPGAIDAVSQGIRNADVNRIHKFTDLDKELNKLWEQVPEKEQAIAQQYGEEIHRLRHKPSSQLQAFLAKAREVDQLMQHTFNIPEEEMIKAHYGPKYMQRMAERGIRLRASDLSNPAHYKQLKQMYEKRIAAGNPHPLYGTLQNRGIVHAALEKMYRERFGGQKLTGSLKEIAKEAAAGKDPFTVAQKLGKKAPGFLQGRQVGKAGKLNERNAYTLAKYNAAVTFNFLAMKDAFVDIMQHAPSEINFPGWDTVHLGDYLRKAAATIGMAPEDTERVVKVLHSATGGSESIKLPKTAAGIIKRAMGQRNDVGLLDNLRHIYTTFMFGYDPTFGIRLALQTAVMQVIAARSPKELIGTWLATVIAAQSEAEKAFPSSIILSHEHGLLDPDLLRSASKYNGARAKWGLLDNPILNAKTDFEYKVHNLQRRAVAIGFLLYAARGGANAGYRQMLKDMFDVSGALERARQMTYVPSRLTAAMDHLRGYFGDYSAESYAAHPWMHSLMPGTAAFWRHTGNMLKTIPANNPIKIKVIQALGPYLKTFQDQDEDPKFKQWGMVPIRTATGEIAKGPDGQNKYLGYSALNPMELGLELTEGLMGMIFADSGDAHAEATARIFRSLHPAIQWLDEMLENRDLEHTQPVPFIKEDINAHPVPLRGRTVYVKDGKLIKEQQGEGLGLVNSGVRAAHKLAPKQMRPLETAATRDVHGQLYKPSPFLGQPLPRYDGTLSPVERYEMGMGMLGLGAQEHH